MIGIYYYHILKCNSPLTTTIIILIIATTTITIFIENKMFFINLYSYIASEQHLT